MAKYTGAGSAGAANSTTANAGIIQLAQGATVRPINSTNGKLVQAQQQPMITILSLYKEQQLKVLGQTLLHQPL